MKKSFDHTQTEGTFNCKVTFDLGKCFNRRAELAVYGPTFEKLTNSGRANVTFDPVVALYRVNVLQL